ncbi:pheA operon leader peptide PheL [Serratia symbiotica]|uniref:Putative Phe operon leader peptide n=1 Tax=Serratia symbiotica SCt-VLC TaxID=1347341 RepID=A0A068RDT4_9GAMM|nr:pheA operon leader peptide PheL [Serratia symbiotica]MBQ0954596.1 pheA operon leader peptide PheL [Serratia symbiotica]QTP15925.1 pheA operon leader peptide PheL [Serratia symbiotica]USS96804.1 pheA operon leader peptide PheL [Serratia symbiotica]CDG49050.1 Putative Phe operon leader peptide [Serratia symbiotica SCt-VLC]
MIRTPFFSAFFFTFP